MSMIHIQTLLLSLQQTVLERDSIIIFTSKSIQEHWHCQILHPFFYFDFTKKTMSIIEKQHYGHEQIV